MHDLQLPILTSILPSNEMQIARGLQLIMDKGHKRVGILGFSFKAGTDDLRESPVIEVIERLIGKGYDLRIYDKNVNIASLVGANRDFILNRIPHISKLMVGDIDAVLDHAETVVIGNKDPDFQRCRSGCGTTKSWWISCESSRAGARMASMTASAGELRRVAGRTGAVRVTEAEQACRSYDSISRLSEWLEKNDYRGYDTFDGLSARFVRPLTFETNFLRTVLQQGVRRFPLNLRPLLGVTQEPFHQGHGLSGARLYSASPGDGRAGMGGQSRVCLAVADRAPVARLHRRCWGNHFDYQSRSFYLPKGVPTVVWTSLIGHAFLDGYDHFRAGSLSAVAVSACEHILRDLEYIPRRRLALCISYIPGHEQPGPQRQYAWRQSAGAHLFAHRQ